MLNFRLELEDGSQRLYVPMLNIGKICEVTKLYLI